jgi:hypothetical protein
MKHISRCRSAVQRNRTLCWGVVLLLLSACLPATRVTPTSPAWTTRPRTACPHSLLLGDVELRYTPANVVGCSAERPCILLHGPRGDLRYIEFSLTDGLKIERDQMLSLAPGAINGRMGAALTGEEIVITLGSRSASSATVAKFSKSGDLLWQTTQELAENYWQRFAVSDDEVAVLFVASTGATLQAFGRMDGVPRRTAQLVERRFEIYDACLLRVGDELFAAWIGKERYVDQGDTILDSAWISTVTGDVRPGPRYRHKPLGHALECAPQGDDVGILLLEEDGLMRFTRVGPPGTAARSMDVAMDLRANSIYKFHEPQLVADGGGFAVAWDARERGHDPSPPRPFVSFLDLDGRRTRIVRLDHHGANIRLVPGPHGPSALYWTGNSRLSAARVRCGGEGPPYSP